MATSRSLSRIDLAGKKMLRGFADPFKVDFQGKLAFVIRVELKSSSTWLILVESLPFFSILKNIPCSVEVTAGILTSEYVTLVEIYVTFVQY